MSFIPSKQVYTTQIVCKFNPPVIGIVYKNRPTDRKKKLYYIEFNGLETLDDAEKVTQLLFKYHPLILNEKNVDFNQIKMNVERVLKQSKKDLDETLKPIFGQPSQYEQDDVVVDLGADYGPGYNDSLTYSRNKASASKPSQSYDMGTNNNIRSNTKAKASPFSYDQDLDDSDFQVEDLL